MSKIRLEDYGDLLNKVNNYEEFQFGCYLGDSYGISPHTPESAFHFFLQYDSDSMKAYWLGRMVAAGYFKE